jgi:hypothetical protein
MLKTVIPDHETEYRIFLLRMHPSYSFILNRIIAAKSSMTWDSLLILIDIYCRIIRHRRLNQYP